MAAFDYHKGNDQVVVQLNELFGDKLNLDIIKTVAESCQFDVHRSSNELVEIANTERVRFNTSKQTPINTSPVHNKTNKSRKLLEIERVIKEINYGYKVLILARGLPGSGKSTLAKSILQNTIGYDKESSKDHILSTDDFFLTRNGAYQFDPSQLGEAHGWNHQRAFNVMSKGYSPVIIDNTNTQMWEMKPYAMMATDFGYYLEILEPDTHWCFNDKELEKRNKHGVSKGSIKNMLERYQKNVTPMKLLTAYDCKYKFQNPPQYRLHPPLPQISSDGKYNNPRNGVVTSRIETKLKSDNLSYSSVSVNQKNLKEATNFLDFSEPFNNFETFNKKISSTSQPISTQSSSVDDILMQSDSSFLKTPVLTPMHSTKVKQSNSLFDNINAWGVDEVALRSWDIVTPIKENDREQFASATIVIDDDSNDIIERKEISTSTDDDDFYILRNILSFPPPATVKVMDTCNRDINRNNPVRPQNIRKKAMIDKSCLTEDLDDHKIRLENLARVFPNVTPNIIKYWYEKCNRDFDCTIELLLSEKEELINVIEEKQEIGIENEISNEEPIIVDSDSSSSASDVMPQSGKQKRKNNSSSSDESHDLKKYIESKVTISEDHYSQKLLKIKLRREQRTSNNSTPEPDSPKTLDEPLKVEIDEKLDLEDFEWVESTAKDDHDDNVDTVELNLGDYFVKQLEDNFGDPNLLYPKGFQPVVQVPVALARQLYTFYIESVYQQMDAQNSIMEDLIKEDEEFARKLQETEEEEASGALFDEPKTVAEPTEIPDIMREQRELNKWQREADKWKEDTPDTLAARLTREKLFSSFPLIERNTLIEILHAHNNNYQETVEILLASAGNSSGDVEVIMRPPINPTIVTEMWEAHESCKNEEDRHDNACSAINYREEASQYYEKRKILYERAQRYYQSGLKEVAQFYSALASKQTRLFEQANSLAATAFLDEHSRRLEDFNTLDLHFLYVKEAVPHLDIFLDRNINLLRLSSSRNTEYLQIITGRGKNSKNGITKIRPAVIGRLKGRDISYQQLNPGLLKVKVTKLSKLTSEL